MCIVCSFMCHLHVDPSEVNCSTDSKVLATAIQNCVDQIIRNVDGDEVCLFLFENEVLTSVDFETVESKTSAKEKVCAL